MAPSPGCSRRRTSAAGRRSRSRRCAGTGHRTHRSAWSSGTAGSTTGGRATTAVTRPTPPTCWTACCPRARRWTSYMAHDGTNFRLLGRRQPRPGIPEHRYLLRLRRTAGRGRAVDREDRALREVITRHRELPAAAPPPAPRGLPPGTVELTRSVGLRDCFDALAGETVTAPHPTSGHGRSPATPTCSTARSTRSSSPPRRRPRTGRSGAMAPNRLKDRPPANSPGSRGRPGAGIGHLVDTYWTPQP